MVALFWSSKIICILQISLSRVGGAIFYSKAQLKNVALARDDDVDAYVRRGKKEEELALHIL